MASNVVLTDEQQLFIDTAMTGRNILVEACIGSGKTTAIQTLCDRLPPYRHVLYLTYNKLLKLDAKYKIKSIHGMVSNYHGFAYIELSRHGVKCGLSELIQTYNNSDISVPYIDTLIIDEYQDIEQEIADMLLKLKRGNPNMQIVVVGDMAQKIYDKTTLDVESFIYDFVGPDAVRMEFTKCFRLCDELASELGEIWGKEIHGVNPECQVEHMSFTDAFRLLSSYEPRDILCLGSNAGTRSEMLNRLEQYHPDKFNKNTVWSNVTGENGATQPSPDCAIFTTYDGCKGMEREVCVIFDWTVDYWNIRLNKPNVRYEILRNIFCVAASRGKRRIVFVDGSSESLTKDVLMDDSNVHSKFESVSIDGMFDFKYVEDIESAFDALRVTEIQPEGETIDIPVADGFIDLAPCVGLYQKAVYFKGVDIDVYIRDWIDRNTANGKSAVSRLTSDWASKSLDGRILIYAALESNQNRYFHQVATPFVSLSQWKSIKDRLSTVLPSDANAQVPCTVPFYDSKSSVAFNASGFADIIHDDIVYGLRFVEALSHVHILQCAMYVAAFDLPAGRVWNVRTNQMYEIRIPDKQMFLDRVTIAVTKGALRKYNKPKRRSRKKIS